MTKAEYIAKYGVDRYNEHIAKMKENQRRRKAGEPIIPRKHYEHAFKDSICVNGYLPLPDLEDYLEQLQEIDRIAKRFQFELRREWREETNERFILCVDGGNKVKNRNVFKCSINLVQIGMDSKTVDKFKETVDKVTADFIVKI